MNRKILWCWLSLLLVAALVLASCGPKEEKPLVIDPYEEYVAGLQEGEFPVPRECFEQAIEEGKLDLIDWAEWWPEELFKGFSEEFGIEVTRDYIASLDEMRAKFILNPEAPYDLLIPGGAPNNYLMQKIGALGQLNHDWLPNVLEYVPEKFFDNKYDPGWKTSVVYGISFPNYVYNSKYVDDPRLPSWPVQLEPDEKYRGRITLFSRMHFAIGSALKYLGYNWFSTDEAELMEARDVLMELKPYIMAFDTWPVPLLMEDEVWIGQMYYGDGLFLHEEYEALLSAIPPEGSALMLVIIDFPIGSPHPAAAHLWLNYLFRPEVMALLIKTIWYSPVHTAVLELLSEEIQEKIIIPEEYLDKLDQFDPRAFEGKGFDLRIAIWEELRK